MSKKLREVFASSQRVKITGVTYTGRNSARIDYEEIDLNGDTVNLGTAECYDVDSVEIDDENYLAGKSVLSASGEFIVNRRTADRTGLGRRKA